MTIGVAGFIIVAYFTIVLVTARRLFQAWRPIRVPGHSRRDRRRIKPDFSRSKIDSDIEAAWSAALAALGWPVILAGFLIRDRPPELEEEKQHRLTQLERKIAECERRLQADDDRW